MKVKVSLDDVRYMRKPLQEVGRITNRIAKEEQVIDLKDLAPAVGEHGQTFCPTVFDGRKAQDAFKEMQLFGLDFDTNNATYDEISSRLSDLMLPIVFSYHTFSSTKEHPKFRIILCHMVPIKEAYIANIILDILKYLFPEADASCFEVSRMFFGGKALIENNTSNAETFHLGTLAERFQEYSYCRDQTNYHRNIVRFADKHRIGLWDRSLGIRTIAFGTNLLNHEAMDEKKGNTIIGIKSVLELPQISSQIEIFKPDKSKKLVSEIRVQKLKILEKVDAKRICKSCRLSSDFFQGIHLSHNQRLGIATNFRFLKGGRKLFLQTIHAYYDDPDLRWEYYWNKNIEHDYQPTGCVKIDCPYLDRCCHQSSIYKTISENRQITRLEEPSYISLEEGSRMLKERLRIALDAKDDSIYLIKAQTGIGKTTVLKELLAEDAKPTILAEPTVKMKQELYEGLSEMGVPCEKIMSLDELIVPPEFRAELKDLYENGHYKEAKAKLREFADQSEGRTQKEKIQSYLNNLETLKNISSHLVMTHAYLLNAKAEFGDRAIVIDEDILQSWSSNIIEISTVCLKRLLKTAIPPSDRANELKKLLRMKKGAYLKSQCSQRELYFKKEEKENLGLYGNLNALCMAGAYYKVSSDVIQFFVPRPLPRQKLIILLATLDPQLYKAFFPNRNIVTLSVDDVRYQGKLKQYTAYSLSRHNIAMLKEKGLGEVDLLGIIRKLSPDAGYGISFKAFDGLIKEVFGMNTPPLHFGNSAGTDRFNGQNGAIIGTPHLNEASYKLPVCYMGHDVREGLSRQRVEYNGAEFPIMTYQGAVLRQFQLYKINSELEQSIGRSRLLRADCTVYVFSNFPCAQAEIHQEDYLESILDEKNPENTC